MKKDSINLYLSTALKNIKVFLTRNIRLKLISLFLAVFLWSYVVSVNPAITRNKTVYDLSVNVTGESILTSRNLAVLSDLSDEDFMVNARVNVAQSSFTLVNSSNVRIEMDLSAIRTTGKQRVQLTGTSVYGDVVQIVPEYIDIEVEELDSRYVPVNVSLKGTDNQSYWYSTKANPSQITVSGPTSVIQTVSSAEISIDVSDLTASQARAERYTLLTSKGTQLDSLLTTSTSSVMVYLDIYPAKTVELPTDPADVVSGKVAPGYELSSVSVSPQNVLIAGDQSLLDGISSIGFSKIDVANKNVSFSRTVTLNTSSDLKYISSTQANVTITIEEIKSTKKIDDIPVVFLGGNYTGEATVSVVISGKYTVLDSIDASDILATVDLTGLTAGEYDLPIVISIQNVTDVTCTASPSVATVSIK